MLSDDGARPAGWPRRCEELDRTQVFGNRDLHQSTACNVTVAASRIVLDHGTIDVDHGRSAFIRRNRVFGNLELACIAESLAIRVFQPFRTSMPDFRLFFETNRSATLVRSRGRAAPLPSTNTKEVSNMKLLSLSTALVFSTLCVACSKAPPSLTYEVAQCPEPVKVSECKIESQGSGPNCIFENTAQRTLSGYPRAWGYDKDNIQVSNFAITEVNGMMPGQKRRASLVVGGEAKTVKRIVVCALDPQNPAVSSRISNVGQAS